MDTGDQALYVWVARANCDGETDVTVWAIEDGAKGWCENVIDEQVTWYDRDDGDGDGDRVAAHSDGDIVATVQRSEVMDPVRLANRYPRDLPIGRDILDGE